MTSPAVSTIAELGAALVLVVAIRAAVLRARAVAAELHTRTAAQKRQD